MTRSFRREDGRRAIRLGIQICWIAALNVFLIFGQAGVSRSEESLLTIEKAVFTNVVSDRQHGTVYTDSAPFGPLWLWMTVQGKEGALKKLEQSGKLPIFHMWIRYSIAGASAEGVTEMIDKILVPAGKAKVIEDLRNEISVRTFFTWRTWSMKENAQPGDWVVKVVYADGTPVICDGNKRCEYKITIK